VFLAQRQEFKLRASYSNGANEDSRGLAGPGRGEI